MPFGTPRDEPPVVVDVPARLVTVEKRTGAPDIKRFDVASVNEAIDRQVRAMKEGENTLCTVFVDRHGAHAAIVGKLRALPGQAAWTVYADKEWSGDWNAGAAFRWAA